MSEVVAAIDRHNLVAHFVGGAATKLLGQSCSDSSAVANLGARPLVDTVMRAPRFKTPGALMMRIARLTFSKLASGSPIPSKRRYIRYFPFHGDNLTTISFPSIARESLQTARAEFASISATD
jgi:hypothetical protein